MRRLDDSALERLRRAADWPSLPGDRFEVLGELGRGGMGAVFRVRDRSLGRDVALKVLAVDGVDLAERLAREARILATLEHPGIVPVHDVGTLDDGRPYYTMRLVEGTSLDELAEQMSLSERLRMFSRICETAAFAHAHGVVHRDLKPSNVMLGAFGEVLVLDWGVAGLLTDSAPRTDAQEVVGTPGFMAPEQARGEPANARCDVYSLGAILRWLMRTNEPAALEAICDKAMTSNPEGRYESAADLAREVARYLERSPVDAYREPIVERLARLVVKYRVPILLVLSYLAMRMALMYFMKI